MSSCSELNINEHHEYTESNCEDQLLVIVGHPVLMSRCLLAEGSGCCPALAHLCLAAVAQLQTACAAGRRGPAHMPGCGGGGGG